MHVYRDTGFTGFGTLLDTVFGPFSTLFLDPVLVPDMPETVGFGVPNSARNGPVLGHLLDHFSTPF